MKTLLIFSTLAVIFCSGECGFISRLFGENDSEKERDTSCVKTDVNEYLDRVLEKARKELPDPMRLPPRSTIVELNDGVLWGLSNITRLGETEVSCDGNTITIKGKITTDELKGRYTWSKLTKHSDREGYIVFISHDFEAECEVIIERHEGEGEPTHPRLEKFDIKKFKDAKIEMTGLGYLTWALGEMTTLLSGIFQRVIGNALEGPIREALERQMREINIE
ncbi:uncharacterized protein [Parasteatoda tepidariorum]|uniref:uncharacterized protein isoform X1 n=1 Tax=Parasteatoda tepidariorum TaxID=114398 RepID=UPI00077FB2BA|nr:uncharacterized protein LOC107450237 isoform X1 [Parasteatoda tepidariorum]XP_015921476.1 uncharacterized protein LOC107450237 isoform X1 [Parasteatoda tepidariorum]